ncbi:MAG: histidine phosphatase family protein [Actinomycetota bacterium]
MTETQLGLFRHGQTDWNIDFLLQGTTDIPMNQTGIAQVELAATAIDKTKWDVLLCSPLDRAIQSAKILSEIAGFENFEVEPLLIERSFGEAEGLSHSQWRERYANLDEIPGGEARWQLTKRTEELLGQIQTRFAGARVLAVSHGALIRSVISIASENTLPKEGERLQNASLNRLAHLDSRWRVVEYSIESLIPAAE